MLTKRSLAKVIILSIITCGVYMYFWYWRTIHELYNAGNYRFCNINTGLQFFFCFLDSVGALFLAMNANSNINIIRTNKGLPETDKKLIYIIFGVFVPIVQVVLIQRAINELPD